MKKQFRLTDLDCAACAAKMENAIAHIEGVQAVTVNFLTQRLTLEAPDDRFDEAFRQAVKVCKRIEPDCILQQ
ncbi:MAG: cation transporter [Clostridia bacterium]